MPDLRIFAVILFALLYNIFWMASALPDHVHNVQQAAKALEVNKRSVSGDILDDTAHDKIVQRCYVGGQA